MLKRFGTNDFGFRDFDIGRPEIVLNRWFGGPVYNKIYLIERKKF
ncbi:MAG: hypothetical protein ABR974_00835 [Bacteroidales bacterium]|jgi:hypothetical protein